LGLYESDPQHVGPTLNLFGEASSGAGTERTRARTSPARMAALRIARECLANSLEPIPTSKLYEAIRSSGVELGGENPKNNLSAMLYHDKGFKSHGRAGWTLSPTEATEASMEPQG
jgi:hypothetical protein